MVLRLGKPDFRFAWPLPADFGEVFGKAEYTSEKLQGIPGVWGSVGLRVFGVKAYMSSLRSPSGTLFPFLVWNLSLYSDQP